MTIKDLIKYYIKMDLNVKVQHSYNPTDTDLSFVYYNLWSDIIFRNEASDYMVAICKAKSFSKNKFEVHICDPGFISIKKVEL